MNSTLITMFVVGGILWIVFGLILAQVSATTWDNKRIGLESLLLFPVSHARGIGGGDHGSLYAGVFDGLNGMQYCDDTSWGDEPGLEPTAGLVAYWLLMVFFWPFKVVLNALVLVCIIIVMNFRAILPRARTSNRCRPGGSVTSAASRTSNGDFHTSRIPQSA